MGIRLIDITVLSDQKSNTFEPMFSEYGFTCQQVVPQGFGSPFCPPSKLLIIPSCFAIPRYYKILSSLDGCRGRIEDFVENGGIVLVYGAGLEGYVYRWLPMRPMYHRLFKDNDMFKKLNARPVKDISPAILPFEPGERGCDGYYSGFEGDIAMAIGDGKPVLIHQKLGKGHVFVSGIFDYPDKKFIEWACSRQYR
jgi:hypothetical protein